MSMPTWLNDVQVPSSSENGAFVSSTDPSVAFMQTPTTASFDFNQLQSQQMQQRLQNGSSRNGSPAFNNPIYQTQPVIPSKRTRPREDSLGASPRQHSGTLPGSRSHTPQQLPYPGYQGAVNSNQQFQTPAAYQRFQQPSSTASLSPVTQNQHFNPQARPQRMQTTSPSPFSPAAHNFASQGSPAQSEHGSRVNTPQNGSQSYIKGLPYGGGPSQSFSPPIVSNSNGPTSTQYGQSFQTFQQQQRMHDMRARQLQQANNIGPQRIPVGVLNPPANPSSQTSNNQMVAHPQQVHQMGKPNNPEQFVRQVAQWMQQRGLVLNPHPTVMGRPLNLMQLFSMVMKHGGSKKITASSQWTDIARAMQVSPEKCVPAAQEIQAYWQTNLSAYEAWFMQSHRQRVAINEQMRVSRNIPSANMSNTHSQFSPARAAVPQQHDPQRQPFIHGQPRSQVKHQTTGRHHVTPQQHKSSRPKQSGYLTPQRGQAQPAQPNTYNRSRVRRKPQYSRPQNKNTRLTSTSIKQKPCGATNKHSISDMQPRKASLSPGFKPVIESIKRRKGHPETHGGYEAKSLVWNKVVGEILALKPSVPTTQELGIIDIRALTMSLRSGIHAEIRLALDTLASLSNHRNPLSLRDCEDLVEILIECAEDQVELLAENAAEVSDAMLISSYEEIARGCRLEVASLQDVHEFGTLEYDLDRSVDRLICITTILRNFSFYQINHRSLADPVVVKFMTMVIRYLGTRNMLLRTYRNTLDFTKDVVVYLSNVSQVVDLPGKDEAFCILHFLLSFAPSPPPNSNSDEDVNFASYIPSTHRYYPLAVDSLAKLLARDDPNRTFYRSIFIADAASLPPYDLLTRTFGLAIAPLPRYGKLKIITAIEGRKPFLVQGLLAAEILTGLIPSSDHVLARSWLSSQDGFAPSLWKIVSALGPRVSQKRGRHPSTGRATEPDPRGHGMITFRGLAVLRKLVEKTKDSEGLSRELPVGILPQRESLLQSLLRPNMDVSLVRQLCNYSGLEI